MSSLLLMQFVITIVTLVLGTALAVSGVRLLWVTGSYLKGKLRQLP